MILDHNMKRYFTIGISKTVLIRIFLLAFTILVVCHLEVPLHHLAYEPKLLPSSQGTVRDILPVSCTRTLSFLRSSSFQLECSRSKLEVEYAVQHLLVILLLFLLRLLQRNHLLDTELTIRSRQHVISQLRRNF